LGGILAPLFSKKGRRKVLNVDPVIMNDIAQIVTALGVIATAVSSIANRAMLNRVNKKVSEAVDVAAQTRKEAVKTGMVAAVRIAEVQREVKETKAKVEEAREAAVAVNTDVLQKVHDAGVEAGKALATNGHSNG
jgi:hypothetical protein